MARIPYPDQDLVPETLRQIARTRLPLNIYRMLMHAETAMPGYIDLGRRLLHDLALDPVLREMAILRVGFLSGSRYEIHQHAQIGRAVGMSEVLLAAVEEGPESEDLDEVETLVLRYTDEVVAHVKASDATFDSLRIALGNRRLAELTLVIGFYMMACRFLENFEIDIEDKTQVPEGSHDRFYRKT
jgi:alkylhydroperoxidase family enzyme